MVWRKRRWREVGIDAPAAVKHLCAKSERLVIDAEVCGGRPIVARTRMRVIDVLDALAAGAGIEELVAAFPI